MGCIYGIRNDINLKWYIGQTIHDAGKTRKQDHFSGHGSRLIKQAIAKYSAENFSFHILHDDITPELLDSYEIETIAKYNSIAPNGYNLTSGGNNGRALSQESRLKISKAMTGEKHPQYGKHPTDEHKQKISDAHKGKKLSDEHRLKLSKAHKGRKQSEEAKKKRSDALKGRKLTKEHSRKISKSNTGKKHSPKTIKKMSEAKKGKKLSAEHRRKLSEIQKNRVTEEFRQKMSELTKGEKNPFYGKTHSAETRRKMSESAKRRCERQKAKSNT